jgi:energy-coupling factor transporter ATP-binding protein EcfA2
VPQGLGTQGSDKRCRLTAQGIRKLEDALKIANGGVQPSNILIADTYGIDRGTVADVINRQKAITRSSIEKLFGPLNLDLLSEDYEFWPVSSKKSKPSQPNPFEQGGLWGCDELLRRIFERLGKAGSQALIGPTGCGKSEILQLIKQVGAERLGRSPDQFLYIDMHWICDATGFFDELGEQLNFGTDKPNELRRRLEKAKRSYVLCLDSIHVLQNEIFFPDTTRNWLRGMAEMPGFPLQLVVSSQRQLRALFPDTSCISSPLADFFNGQTEYLSYWNEDQLQTVLAERLMSTEVNFETAQIKQLFEDTQGNPKAVREMAARLYDAKIREYLA